MSSLRAQQRISRSLPPRNMGPAMHCWSWPRNLDWTVLFTRAKNKRVADRAVSQTVVDALNADGVCHFAPEFAEMSRAVRHAVATRLPDRVKPVFRGGT